MTVSPPTGTPQAPLDELGAIALLGSMLQEMQRRYAAGDEVGWAPGETPTVWVELVVDEAHPDPDAQVRLQELMAVARRHGVPIATRGAGVREPDPLGPVSDMPVPARTLQELTEDAATRLDELLSRDNRTKGEDR